MTSFGPFSESRSGTTNRGTNATAFPKGERLNPRAAAEALQSLNPGYTLPRSRFQTMAENLMAAGEQALAMNPIRLASPAQARANQHAMYGAHAPEASLPPVEVVQPQGVYTQGVSGEPGEPVELWVNPPDSRQIPFGRDPIPVPSPRSQKDQSRLPPLKHQSRLAPTKDQSRLEPPQGTPRHPSGNPNRVPSETFGMTVAPKGDRARMATHEEANQYAPWDTVGDMASKTWQNWGRSHERNADQNIWAMENRREADGLAGRFEEGVWQRLYPQEQKHEAYVKAVEDRYKDRYGSVEKAKKTLVEDGRGVLSDIYFPLGRELSMASKVLRSVPVGRFVVPEIEDPTGAMVHKSLPYMEDNDRPPQSRKPKPSY